MLISELVYPDLPPEDARAKVLATIMENLEPFMFTYRDTPNVLAVRLGANRVVSNSEVFLIEAAMLAEWLLIGGPLSFWKHSTLGYVNCSIRDKTSNDPSRHRSVVLPIARFVTRAKPGQRVRNRNNQPRDLRRSNLTLVGTPKPHPHDPIPQRSPDARQIFANLIEKHGLSEGQAVTVRAISKAAELCDTVELQAFLRYRIVAPDMIDQHYPFTVRNYGQDQMYGTSKANSGSAPSSAWPSRPRPARPSAPRAPEKPLRGY